MSLTVNAQFKNNNKITFDLIILLVNKITKML